MTKQNYIFIALFVAVLILALALGCSFMINANAKANADYQDILNDNNAIVNFNQIMLYPNNATLTNGQISSNFNINDKLYIYFHITTTGDYSIYSSSQTLFYLSSGEYTRYNIFTMQYNTPIAIYTSSGNMQVDYFNIINLTQMFGAGNEPNLQQCKELFVADYYAYNTGSSISLSGLNAYADGVQSVYDTLTYNYVGEDSYNLLQPYAFYRGATYYNGSPSKEQSHISVASVDGDGWSSGNGFALFYPFTSSLMAGDTITLNGMLGSATDLGSHQQATTYIIIRYGENVYDVLSVNAIVLQDATSNNVNAFTYTLPSDATGLVFYSIQPFRIKDFTIQVRSLSVNNLVDSAYKSGYQNGSNPYQVGNSGYENIYQLGYQAGQNASVSAARKKTYTFTAFLGALFDVPVNTIKSLLDFNFLGFNLKNFVFSLLTLSIVFALIKFILVKSGGDK